MKTYWGSGCIEQSILDIGIRWKHGYSNELLGSINSRGFLDEMGDTKLL
jgi:hypothetical protein